ncbi:hypothetical protein HU200_050110 [Digitaria exilis]|uniref:Uncharacterized protein n=1 Tax=Digitaria exilis TaxID=1010633 RepID=A0A835AN61_9POAL|nr:hypothetical protein HU200_050110 [Digitaria exilis]
MRWASLTDWWRSVTQFGLPVLPASFLTRPSWLPIPAILSVSVTTSMAHTSGHSPSSNRARPSRLSRPRFASGCDRSTSPGEPRLQAPSCAINCPITLSSSSPAITTPPLPPQISPWPYEARFHDLGASISLPLQAPQPREGPRTTPPSLPDEAAITTRTQSSSCTRSSRPRRQSTARMPPLLGTHSTTTSFAVPSQSRYRSTAQDFNLLHRTNHGC